MTLYNLVAKTAPVSKVLVFASTNVVWIYIGLVIRSPFGL